MRALPLVPLLIPLLLWACAPTPEKPRGIFDLSSKPELSRPPADISTPSAAAGQSRGRPGPTAGFGAGSSPGGL